MSRGSRACRLTCLGRVLILLLLVALAAGCAASSTTVIDEEIVTNPKPMTTYKSLLVRDFELKRELYTNAAEARMSERERRYSQLPGQLNEQIQRYVKARRIYQTVSKDDPPGATTLILKGKFTRVSRFRISLETLLIDGLTGQEVAYFRQTLWDIFDSTETVGRLARDIADFIDRIQYK